MGAWLYEQQGFAQDNIQGLMGYADVKMTEHYQSGHGPEAVIYHKVKADLKLLRVGGLPNDWPKFSQTRTTKKGPPFGEPF
ncbi:MULTISPECIES: hypothetical protein [unclassified Pseudomonas]|uniref:hypothetical protein n=1 Tax=unclassified Pseudomonas TaxID=196821 RepID=UPI00129709FC|nr:MULTISPECIES: hypothetical protein [unclassified Pseudomonas]